MPAHKTRHAWRCPHSRAPVRTQRGTGPRSSLTSEHTCPGESWYQQYAALARPHRDPERRAHPGSWATNKSVARRNRSMRNCLAKASCSDVLVSSSGSHYAAHAVVQSAIRRGASHAQKRADYHPCKCRSGQHRPTNRRLGATRVARDCARCSGSCASLCGTQELQNAELNLLGRTRNGQESVHYALLGLSSSSIPH